MNEELKHLIELLTAHRRRMYILELQSAQFGAYVPPYIIIDLEDAKKQIDELEARIARIEQNKGTQSPDTTTKIDDEERQHIEDIYQPLRKLRIFLCHSSGDKPVVRLLYIRLQKAGYEPWLDEEDILPGQDWEREIPKAVQRADVVLVCLSPGAISKTGYIQKEIKFALDVADLQPEGIIFIIPVRLQDCEVPDRLRRWQWVNLFDENGYQRLTRTLNLRAAELGLT